MARSRFIHYGGEQGPVEIELEGAAPDGPPGLHEYWLESEPVAVRQFTIARHLVDIPEEEACPFCGGSTARTVLLYETPYRDRGQLILARVDVPGYRCCRCDMEMYDLESSTQALRAVKEAACAANDSAVVDRLDAMAATRAH